MKKYTRYRSDNGEEVEMFATEGVIDSIASVAKVNTNGNLYYTFTAIVDLPDNKTMRCLGQVYENAFEFLGDIPKAKEKYVFAIELDQLMTGNNKVWTILGHTVEDIDQETIDNIRNI